MSRVLTAYAVRRAHVLVVEVPGHWRLRAAVERRARWRGWRLAESPADADVLAVCGVPGPELARLVERVWSQLPGPRVRLDLGGPDGLEAALDSAARRLADTPSQRQDAQQRSSSPDGAEDHEDIDHKGMGHKGMDHDGIEPDGIPLAAGGEDRDGLEMDVLHLALGPVLRHWPAGLVLHCSLQGDVVVGAKASVVDEGQQQADGVVPRLADGPEVDAAWLCDNAAAVLALAGWPDAASAAHRARDALLDGTDDATVQRGLERLVRQVRSSRLLRWSLGGVGAVTAGDLERHRLPERLRGDVHDRLVAMLEQARDRQTAPGHFAAPAAADGSAAMLRALPDVVTGLDLAATRLVVASLALATVPSRQQVPHG